MAIMIHEMLQHKNFSAIFDDADCKAEHRLVVKVDTRCCYTSKNDRYYVTENETATEENIKMFLRFSTAFWHSLAVISKATFANVKDCKLTSENFKEICHTAELILIGAYDAEGYIFWEPSKNYP